MTTQEPRYLAFMLRLWQVHDNGESTWRASLEDPHSGERRGFASLETLFAFLREQTCTETRQQEDCRKVN